MECTPRFVFAFLMSTVLTMHYTIHVVVSNGSSHLPTKIRPKRLPCYPASKLAGLEESGSFQDTWWLKQLTPLGSLCPRTQCHGTDFLQIRDNIVTWLGQPVYR